MSGDHRPDRSLAELLGDIAPDHAPARLRRDFLAAMDGVRPRPRWFALIKEPPMRLSARVAVGSPTFRLVSLTAIAMALILALGAAVVTAASLLPSPKPVPTACAAVVCPVAPLAEPRSSATATRLADGTVLVIGGGTKFWSVLPATAELWDPATETFRTAGALHEGRHSHTATLLPDGRVLVTGGYVAPDAAGRDVILATAEVWDPGTETFSPTGSMAVPRGGHAAALLPDGRVLVMGGWSTPRHAGTDTTEIWDPATGSFGPGPTLDTPEPFFSAVTLDDGRVLVARGPVGIGVTSEILDPATMTFTPTGSLPGVRFRAVLLADGRVLVVGGSTAGTFAEVWDPATGTSTPTGSPASEFTEFQTETLLHDGRVLLTQGPGEVWDPATGTFGAVGQTLPGAGTEAAALLDDGRVLVVGGFDNSADALTDARVWDLDGVVGAVPSPSARVAVSPTP